MAQTFSGAVKYNSRVTAVISRNGDLLGDCWLESVMVKAAGTTFYPAEAVCKSITVELGGQQLDKITATWMRVYDNLYRNTSTDRSAYKGMTDFVDGEATGTAKRFFTPLLFWFCRSPGNYLPLIALQYHELRITFEFEDQANLAGIGSTALEATLWCDYVYLDQDERKKFAAQPHEYLIEQILVKLDLKSSLPDAWASASGQRVGQPHMMFAASPPSSGGALLIHKKWGERLRARLGDTLDCGNPLKRSIRRLLRNQKCQSRVMTSPTVKTRSMKASYEAGNGQSAGTRLPPLCKGMATPQRLPGCACEGNSTSR